MRIISQRLMLLSSVNTVVVLCRSIDLSSRFSVGTAQLKKYIGKLSGLNLSTRYCENTFYFILLDLWNELLPCRSLAYFKNNCKIRKYLFSVILNLVLVICKNTKGHNMSLQEFINFSWIFQKHVMNNEVVMY